MRRSATSRERSERREKTPDKTVFVASHEKAGKAKEFKKSSNLVRKRLTFGINCKVLMFGKTNIEATIIIRAKTKGGQRQDFGKMEYKIEAKCRDGADINRADAALYSQI